MALHIIRYAVNKSSRLIADVFVRYTICEYSLILRLFLVWETEIRYLGKTQNTAVVKTTNVTGALRVRRRLREENGSGFGIMRASAGVFRRVHIIFALTAGCVSEERMCICMQFRVREYRIRAKNGTRILDALYMHTNAMQ